MDLKKGYNFQYTAPKFTLDKERNKIFVRGFGGVKKYFDSEDEYNSYVEKDKEKARKRYAEDFKKTQKPLKFHSSYYEAKNRKMNQERAKQPGLRSSLRGNLN